MLVFAHVYAYLEFILLGWHDEARDEYAAVCDKIKNTLDMNARADATYEALKLFVDYDPWFPVCESLTVSAASEDVGGVQYYLAGNLFYQDLYWN